MDGILTSISFTTSLKNIFACRIYLQITLLSDITGIKGTSIMNTVLISSRNKYRHHTSDWSLQQNPIYTLGTFGTELYKKHISEPLPHPN